MQVGWEEHGRDHADAEEDGYVICPVQLGAEPMENQSDMEDPMLDPNVNAWMDEGFHCGMVQAANGADAHFRCCFNCLEEAIDGGIARRCPYYQNCKKYLTGKC